MKGSTTIAVGYGGAIRNALHELAALMASLHDADGRIAVPAFMADVPRLTAQQQEDTAALPLPVRIFTQMPIASHRALSLTVDSTWPAR